MSITRTSASASAALIVALTLAAVAVNVAPAQSFSQSEPDSGGLIAVEPYARQWLPPAGDTLIPLSGLIAGDLVAGSFYIEVPQGVLTDNDWLRRHGMFNDYDLPRSSVRFIDGQVLDIAPWSRIKNDSLGLSIEIPPGTALSAPVPWVYQGINGPIGQVQESSGAATDDPLSSMHDQIPPSGQ